MSAVVDVISDFFRLREARQDLVPEKCKPGTFYRIEAEKHRNSLKPVATTKGRGLNAMSDIRGSYYIPSLGPIAVAVAAVSRLMCNITSIVVKCHSAEDTPASPVSSQMSNHNANSSSESIACETSHLN